MPSLTPTPSHTPYTISLSFKAGSKAINAMQYGSSAKLLATGEFDGCARLYDPQNGSANTAIVVGTLTCHKAAVSDVAWHPEDPHKVGLWGPNAL